MRINLVNGATYAPAKITPKQKTDVGQATQAVKAQNKISLPGNLSLDGLSQQEATLLQKLFGEISKAERTTETPKSLRPGQFIDITA
jgi:hypothetical protein